MDLSVELEGVRLNVRVTVLLETRRGYIFEKDRNGFYFPIGGRIKVNETSLDAAKRELKEEINLRIERLDYVATSENFFQYDEKPFHEISVIYYAQAEDADLPANFSAFDIDGMNGQDIRPAIIKKIIADRNSDMRKSHYMVREN